MSETKFAVSRFQNRNGVTSWRVSGWLHGVRIRKNFLTKEEAAAEKATLEIKAVQVSAGFRPAMTLLTDAQLRDAEASWHRLQGRPQPLSFYVDYALANYRPPEHQKPLAAAVAVYLAERTKAFEQDMLSPRQLRSIRNELEALQTHFPKATVCQFTAPILRAYLERGDSVLKTYNNRRGVLSTFFKFAFQHDWIASNPVERTPHHRINHRRGSAVKITAEKARELMAYVETFRDAALVTYFAICLFAGIRPCIRGGEIKKLKAESVRLDTGVIHIEPEVSKVRMKRNVTIQPNLAAWLRAYPLAEFPIVPPNSMNTRKEVFDKFALTHDVLRHTFISMFVAKFRSMGEAALQAGNSEAIIRKHYLDLKNPAEAEEYFSILPNRRAAPAAATAEIVSIHSRSTLRAAM